MPRDFFQGLEVERLPAFIGIGIVLASWIFKGLAIGLAIAGGAITVYAIATGSLSS